MSIVTSQQLTRYYEHYKTTDVTFNKQVITALGLVVKGVYLKIQDRQLPCMVFSSSLTSARVIASVPAAVMTVLRQANNRLALRWCFKLPEKVEPITFFVTCRPTGFTHYAVQGPDVQFVALEYTQRPPDDLIQILGSLLEASANSQRRKDERIIVTPETLKKLGLESREAALVVGGTSYKCLLRDLSFSGAKVVVSGNAETFAEKSVSLKFTRSEQTPEMTLSAAVVRVEEVGGRKDILAVSMQYSADAPMSYKLLINSYVSTTRKLAPEAASPVAPAAAPPEESPAAEPSALDIPSEGDPPDPPDG
ncbi:MAG: PilZN3 domain-containing protein [Spirochaetia bacterium]